MVACVHLKTLTLRGFKSFASATTLNFEPGITCVVGPNGSGKSNVVDALAWVMGEQGAKTLRGGSMVDVIFAGTSSRPPLGRAEVSLTIDNSDGLLPIDYTEVSISRTLFRGGGSEYAINGEPCRLLDIQELLSDTGMGREMHVIVGRGQLDTVLSAGPEERRGFIEEAAGILKHRRRKDKALRKLEAMRGNVDRLTDLTTEIRRQLGPLAKQADVARRAQVIQADRHDARARLLADDVAQLMAALAQDTADDTALRKRRDDVQRAHDAAQQKLAAVEQRAADVARQARAASDTWHALQSLRERLKGLRSLAAERARLLPSDTPARPGSDPRQLDEEARRVEEAHRELGEETAEAANALEAAVAARAAAEDAEEQAQRRLVSLQQAIADRREGLARLTGEVAARRTALEANGAELDRMRAAVVEAEERAEAAEGQFRALEQQITGAEAGEEGLDAAHEAALAEHAAAEEALAQLRASEQEAESQRRTWQARCEALSMSMASRDGTTTLLGPKSSRRSSAPCRTTYGSRPDTKRRWPRRSGRTPTPPSSPTPVTPSPCCATPANTSSATSHSSSPPPPTLARVATRPPGGAGPPTSSTRRAISPAPCWASCTAPSSSRTSMPRSVSPRTISPPSPATVTSSARASRSAAARATPACWNCRPPTPTPTANSTPPPRPPNAHNLRWPGPPPDSSGPRRKSRGHWPTCTPPTPASPASLSS